MKTRSKLVRLAVLVSSLTLPIVGAQNLPAFPAKQSGQDVEKLMKERTDEICDLLAPVPGLLFSRSYWYQRLTNLEIRRLRDSLDPDARYVDLFDDITPTGLPWEYVLQISTESLLIVKRHAPL